MSWAKWYNFQAYIQWVHNGNAIHVIFTHIFVQNFLQQSKLYWWDGIVPIYSNPASTRRGNRWGIYVSPRNASWVRYRLILLADNYIGSVELISIIGISVKSHRYANHVLFEYKRMCLSLSVYSNVHSLNDIFWECINGLHLDTTRIACFS